MKKNFQDTSKQAFYQSNKPQNNYNHPSPTFPTKPNEFDKLVTWLAQFWIESQKIVLITLLA